MTGVAATAPTVVIEALRLHRFRNYADTSVLLAPGLNLITGDNAQGKTNLLEAVATLALTRSPRSASIEEMVTWGASAAAIEARLQRPSGARRLALRLSRAQSGDRWLRSTAIDGSPRPARDVLGLCPVVLFWPDDLQLVSGGPERRRRQLDMLLSQLDRRAADDLLQYRRALAQRNAILRQLRSGAAPGPLNEFTSALTEHGARVRLARATLVSALASCATTTAAAVSEGREQLSFAYLAGSRRVPPDSAIDHERDELAGALSALSHVERSHGLTLAGPHRDDVSIELDGRLARGSTSQGQQRTIVLALKLAEVDLVRRIAGAGPVLLLDDVLSELDGMRRLFLFEALARVAPMQLLVTATDATAFPPAAIAAARHLHVHRGTVSDVKIH